MFPFDNFPKLETNQLILRNLNFDDIDAIFELRTNQKINSLITRKIPKNKSEAKEFIKTCHFEFEKENRIFWAMESKKTNKIVGAIVFHNILLADNYVEIGYELHPNFHQKGLMSEAMESVLNFGFQKIDLKTIEAFTHKNNLASVALLKKYDFVFQPNRKCNIVADNRIWKLEKK